MIKTAKIVMLAGTALALTACFPKEGQYQGLSPMLRAEVSLTRFAHDIRVSSNGALSKDEQTKLYAFLQRVDVRYGDEVQLDPGAQKELGKTQDMLDIALYPYGLDLQAAPIAIGAMPEAGVVRVVVTRHLAKPPTCPNNSQPNTPNYENAPMSNFSCSVRTNLAAQVADPADLVGGKRHSGPVSGEPERAIDNFRTRDLTGTERLQGTSTADAVGDTQ
ncbi:MAG: CpaD family pilus assembly lipoprotein [Pseudomonadota bacterium]